jgi:hypothetical protein
MTRQALQHQLQEMTDRSLLAHAGIDAQNGLRDSVKTVSFWKFTNSLRASVLARCEPDRTRTIPCKGAKQVLSQVEEGAKAKNSLADVN